MLKEGSEILVEIGEMVLSLGFTIISKALFLKFSKTCHYSVTFGKAKFTAVKAISHVEFKMQYCLYSWSKSM